MYTNEQVDEALKLTAAGSVGVISTERLIKELDKLPEKLARKVRAAILAAQQTKQIAKLLNEMKPC